MQIQPAAGMNATNGFLQSIPVQNIPGLGNVQVIPASALQPATVQALPATAATPIVAAPTVQLDSNDPTKWQILQTLQTSNGTLTTSTPITHQHQVSTASNSSTETDTNKQHRRRVACTCPNCGDGDRCVCVLRFRSYQTWTLDILRCCCSSVSIWKRRIEICRLIIYKLFYIKNQLMKCQKQKKLSLRYRGSKYLNLISLMGLIGLFVVTAFNRLTTKKYHSCACHSKRHIFFFPQK